MDSTISFDLSPPPTTVPYNHAVTHPPYAEMIYKAIESLKEKDGSSKRAIGKYIEQAYTNLLPPQPQHTALLTQHLNHLKSAGLLIMVKKSYKLPSTLPPPPTLVSGSAGSQSQSQSHLPFTPLTQRGRGRPPKPKPIQLNAQPNDTLQLVRRPRGRPPGSFRSKSVKRLGRPPKPKSVSNALQRRPGRPPKVQSQLTAIPPAAPVVPDGPQVTVRSSRPRGRPKKYADEMLPGAGGRPPKLAVVGRPKSSTGRPVGRPKGAKSAKKLAYEDLTRKLEHFQSKVKESLEVLKPYFYHESPATALAAIQELETLATLDLKAPPQQFLEQTPLEQQLPPQQFMEQPPLEQQLPPQQLAQTQIYEQQYLQMPMQQEVQQLFQPQTLAPS